MQRILLSAEKLIRKLYTVEVEKQCVKKRMRSLRNHTQSFVVSVKCRWSQKATFHVKMLRLPRNVEQLRHKCSKNGWTLLKWTDRVILLKIYPTEFVLWMVCLPCVQFRLSYLYQGRVPLTTFCSKFKFDGKVAETSTCCNSITGHQTATTFCSYHDSTAHVKFCGDHFVRIWVRVKCNFHHIWNLMEIL